jgi:hypothetical protein
VARADRHRDSRFLYVLDTRLLLTPPGTATLSGFRIGHDGHLTQVVDPAKITLQLREIRAIGRVRVRGSAARPPGASRCYARELAARSFPPPPPA